MVFWASSLFVNISSGRPSGFSKRGWGTSFVFGSKPFENCSGLMSGRRLKARERTAVPAPVNKVLLEIFLLSHLPALFSTDMAYNYSKRRCYLQILSSLTSFQIFVKIN